MKHFYLFTLFFTFSSLLYAQLDTTFKTTKVVEESFEEQQMTDAKSYLLNSLMDEKHALRMGFEGTSLPPIYPQFSLRHLPLANSLFLEYEYRIKTGFSINTQLHYNRATATTTSQVLVSIDVPIIHNYGFYIEPRWYFKKKQQLKEQISGNNLIGIYASLLAGIKYVQFPNPVFYSSDGDRQFLKSQYQYSTLNLGWQRRFNKHGFLHLQIGTGIQRTPQKIIELVSHNGPFQINPLPKWRWISSYKIGVGLALNNSRTSTIEKNIWTYHKVDNDMWKVDLFGFVYSLNKEGVSGKINIGYEKSIQQSSFSIATNLLFHQQVHPGRYKQNQLSIQIAPRYYYNLKKRMRRGKTANDLSAEYFSIRNQWNIHDEHWIRRRYKLSILWGIQRRVFEKMYINYELGRIIPFNTSEYIFLDETISELKIGLAF